MARNYLDKRIENLDEEAALIFAAYKYGNQEINEYIEQEDINPLAAKARLEPLDNTLQEAEEIAEDAIETLAGQIAKVKGTDWDLESGEKQDLKEAYVDDLNLSYFRD